MIKVEDVKRPLVKGELLLVPCLIKIEREVKNEDELWLDETDHATKKKIHILPVINHPHNDIENGQKASHYHLDYRFIRHKNDGNFPNIKNNHSTHVYGSTERPNKNFGKLEYHLLPVINEEFTGITPVEYIERSKLKHNCIHKGKCPHRGYDLSQVAEDENGIRTCPLHGLRFNKQGNVINKKASST